MILGHTNDIPNLIDDLAVFKPNYVLSVPRVFEKVYNSAKQKAYDGGKGSIFDKAADTAIEYSKATEKGSAGLVLTIKHKIFDALVYNKLRAALGGNCEGAISGGAPLGARLGHFFRGVGIPSTRDTACPRRPRRSPRTTRTTSVWDRWVAQSRGCRWPSPRMARCC